MRIYSRHLEKANSYKQTKSKRLSAYATKFADPQLPANKQQRHQQRDPFCLTISVDFILFIFRANVIRVVPIITYTKLRIVLSTPFVPPPVREQMRKPVVVKRVFEKMTPRLSLRVAAATFSFSVPGLVWTAASKRREARRIRRRSSLALYRSFR